MIVDTAKIFTLQYFIDKFSAIPWHLFGEGMFNQPARYNGGDITKYCALGFCGMREGSNDTPAEASALLTLFEENLNGADVYQVNDGVQFWDECGDNPKERILFALDCIKNQYSIKDTFSAYYVENHGDQ